MYLYLPQLRVFDVLEYIYIRKIVCYGKLKDLFYFFFFL